MSKFRVGDRVRSTSDKPNGMTGVAGVAGVVRGIDDDLYAVEFDGLEDGHGCCGLVDYGRGLWMREDQIEFVFSHPIDDLHPARSSPTAKFQVVYIEDEDETFDTQEEAEAHAYELAQGDPGAQFAVFKRLAIARPTVKIERFA
jgi:hypothetical protein